MTDHRDTADQCSAPAPLGYDTWRAYFATQLDAQDATEFNARHRDDEPTRVRSALAGGHWL